MFVFLIAIVGAYFVGNVLGKSMPHVSEWLLGVLVGLVVSYLLIYDNASLWIPAMGEYSPKVLEQTRTLMTVIGVAVVAVATALGAKKARKAAPSKTKKKD